MSIHVITPYYNPNLDWLWHAHQSVRNQTLPARHVMVCDGGESAELESFVGDQIVLGRNHNDSGNTPRIVGTLFATAGGTEGIAYLDVDCWYHPDHLAALAAFAAAERLDACSSTRMLHKLDGTPLMRCPHVDGLNLIDTNCLFFTPKAFPYLMGWLLTPEGHEVRADQYLWRFMRSVGMRMGFLNQITVGYRTRHPVHYALAGVRPPTDAEIAAADPHAKQTR